MARIPFRKLRHLGLLVATLTACSVTLAGPHEDYQEGARSYARGDLMAAMTTLKRAADGGHAAAQALYALILDRADSDEEAVGYYRKSAEQGNPDGQFGYGAMLASGEGTKRDVDQAREWILKAAEQGHKLAINELALAYLKGQLNIPPDERQGPQALRWVRQAAENDFVPAMDAMAAAYKTGGYGLAADASQAEMWSTKARKARGLQGKRKGERK
jgi:TPR repeat protein